MAAAAVLAAAGRLEEAPAGPPRSPRSRGATGLVEGRRGQPELPRCFWGALTGKNPTDRAKKGSKRHLLVDRNGTPMAVRITGAQRNESLEAMPLLDDVPPIQQPRGGRRRRPEALHGDRQYGTPRNREGLKQRRIEDHLARPRTPHGSGLGKIRWGGSQKRSHAALRLDCCLVDVCVTSSSCSSSVFNSARHSGGVQRQSVLRFLAIASRVCSTTSSHLPDTTAARS